MYECEMMCFQGVGAVHRVRQYLLDPRGAGGSERPAVRLHPVRLQLPGSISVFTSVLTDLCYFTLFSIFLNNVLFCCCRILILFLQRVFHTAKRVDI